MRAWVIFSTDAGSAVTAQIASDLLEPTITARPRTDRLKPVHWRKVGDAGQTELRFAAKLLKSLRCLGDSNPCFRRERAKLRPLFDCARSTRSSISSTHVWPARASVHRGARSTTFVLGPCCGSKNG